MSKGHGRRKHARRFSGMGKPDAARVRQMRQKRSAEAAERDDTNHPEDES